MRSVVLDPGSCALGHRNGEWIFAGQDAGRSVRLKVRDADWRAIQKSAGGLAAAYRKLEHLAALATEVTDDGFGGYFVKIRPEADAFTGS